MDFVAVVDQAIALLRQRGRLTYRTLQLQFQLDDVHLQALIDESSRASGSRPMRTGPSWSGRVPRRRLSLLHPPHPSLPLR